MNARAGESWNDGQSIPLKLYLRGEGKEICGIGDGTKQPCSSEEKKADS